MRARSAAHGLGCEPFDHIFGTHLLGQQGFAAETAGAGSILLVASNRITDASFERSVVLVTRHGGDEPLGVVLNRPTEVPLKDVFGEYLEPPVF